MWFLPNPVCLSSPRSTLSMDLWGVAILLPLLLECWDTGLLASLAMKLIFPSPSGDRDTPQTSLLTLCQPNAVLPLFPHYESVPFADSLVSLLPINLVPPHYTASFGGVATSPFPPFGASSREPTPRAHSLVIPHELWRAGAEGRGLTERLSPFLSLFSSGILFCPCPIP